MNRKDKHINKFLHDPLPDPEIPADDAWAEMRDMLDNTAGQGANGQGQLSSVWKSIAKFKGLLMGVSVVATATVVALIVLNAETKNQKSTENQFIKPTIQDSATVKTNPETNALKSETERVDMSPLKTTNATDAVATTNPGVSDVVTYNPATPKTGGIEDKNNPSVNPPAGAVRVRTGAAQAHATPSRDTRVPSGAHEKERRAFPSRGTSEIGNEPRTFPGRATDESGKEPGKFSGHANEESENGAFPSSAARQNDDASPVNSLKSGQPPQETVPSFSHERNTHSAPAQIPLNNLAPLAGHFRSMTSDLSKLVKKPALPLAPQPPAKSRNPVWQDIHFGPEWNINRAFVSTDYMFTGADSVKHPLRLAIPGVFISKTWNRHSATFIFNPTHSYFGDKERVAQRVDTTRVSDSIFIRIDHNTNFIKAFGVNFSLQYQYHTTSWFSLAGGLSYARYSAALLRKETEYGTGTIIDEAHLTVRGREALKSYIRPQQWNIRAGILFHSPGILHNRLQVAWMTIIPVSSLSLKGFKSVKSPNIQLSLRFLVK